MKRSKILGGGALAALMVLATAAPALAKPLTEKQWQRQVGAICTQIGNEIGALDAEMLQDFVQPTPAQAAALVERAALVFEEGIAAIDALEEPKSMNADVRRFVRTATRELDALRNNPSSITESDGNVFPKSHKIRKQLGAKCEDG